jgi:SOS-response transcriptional repressor LexA/transcriptional regulator with XRE-family HTH domain
MNTMGTKIRRARVRLALTLDELAHKTGISKAYLSLIETGRLANPPSDEKLRTLAEAVGLPPNELVGRAHVQRIPPDIRALLDEIMRRQGVPAPGGGATPDGMSPGGTTSGGTVPGGAGPGAAPPGGDARSGGGTGSAARPAGKHGLPLNLDAAYRNGVLQELADRNGGNVEPVTTGGPASPASSPWAGLGQLGLGPPGLSSAPVAEFAAAAGDVSVDVTGPASGRRPIPIVNKVSAGYPSDFTDLSYPPRVADAYVSAPGVDDPDAFAARVSGDSMAPKYGEGDIVVFSPAAAWKDGADCFVRFDDGQTTFKRVYAERDAAGREVLRLQPRNDRYRPRVLLREEVTGVYRAVSVYRAVGD